MLSSTSLTMSLSNIERMLGAPSRIVTSEPKLAYAEPNSEPITPTTDNNQFLGTSLRPKPPVESITRPPNLKPFDFDWTATCSYDSMVERISLSAVFSNNT